MGMVVIVLLPVALLLAQRRAWAADGALGVAKRAAFMIVLMIGLHSQLEYPLWYVYFLLPAAFAWGFALSRSSEQEHQAAARVATLSQGSAFRRGVHPLVVGGLVMLIAATAAVLDYGQVASVYDPPPDAPPLEERIARGQRSPLFGHHADYAAATALRPPEGSAVGVTGARLQARPAPVARRAVDGRMVAGAGRAGRSWTRRAGWRRAFASSATPAPTSLSSRVRGPSWLHRRFSASRRSG